MAEVVPVLVVEIINAPELPLPRECLLLLGTKVLDPQYIIFDLFTAQIEAALNLLLNFSSSSRLSMSLFLKRTVPPLLGLLSSTALVNRFSSRSI